MEILPLVDESDRIVGAVDRATAHRKGILHRGAMIVVVDSDCRILLQRRSRKKEICPLKWDLSVAEHVKLGESYEQAAVRGLREELGLEASPSELQILRGPHREEHHFSNGLVDNEFITLYVLRYDGGVKIDKDEVEEAKFFTLGEVEGIIRDRKATPWFEKEWRYIREYLKNCSL